MICTHDLDGQLLFVNPAAARSLGYGPDDWIGRNLRDFVAPDARPLYEDYLRRINEQQADSGLLRVVARNGAERVWLYHNVRSEMPGESPYVVGHALDITERVRAEQAVRSNREDLKRAYEALDERVRTRTSEFEAANELLRAEIAERRRAEAMREAVMVRERNTLAFLAAVSDQLTRALDWESTLKTLARLPVPFLADWTTLLTLTEDGSWCWLGGRASDGQAQGLLSQLSSLPTFALQANSLAARAVRTRAIVVAHWSALPLTETVFGRGPHLAFVDPLPCASMAVAPLVEDERVVGLLTLASAAPDRYQSDELVIVDDLVRRGRVAVTQVRLYREAQDANR
ncbi:MAG: PAS domain S-box protein, partial [Vicinamibacterales bacterium]